MVGIGGIGMSALAQLLQHEGGRVSGSDREASPTTDILKRAGIEVFFEHDATHIQKDTELLIYSDAVPEDNVERAFARAKGIPELSYFQVLGEVSKTKRTIAITGTHGKTTTTAMIASILKHAGKQPTAIVGSIVGDWGPAPLEREASLTGSNFLAGNSDIFVVEACEYKNHVLELSPEVLVVTNAEWDHTDFFPSLTDLQNTFKTAAGRVPPLGVVVTAPKDIAIAPILKNVQASVVDYTQEDVPELSLVGEFNRMNARAAKAAAQALCPDIPNSVVDEVLKNFKGVWRRFEYKGITPKGALLYDDYAHHPTAIKKTIEAAQEKFPDKKLVIAFHPHLYSRTRDLFSGFADALALADEVFILPVYAAREMPDPSFNHASLAEAINSRGGHAEAISGIEETVQKFSLYGADTFLCTMGAGDVYKAIEHVLHTE